MGNHFYGDPFALDGNGRMKSSLCLQKAQFGKITMTFMTLKTSRHDMHLIMNEAFCSMSACMTFP